jgi:hypothetical protein
MRLAMGAGERVNYRLSRFVAASHQRNQRQHDAFRLSRANGGQGCFTYNSPSAAVALLLCLVTYAMRIV